MANSFTRAVDFFFLLPFLNRGCELRNRTLIICRGQSAIAVHLSFDLICDSYSSSGAKVNKVSTEALLRGGKLVW